MSLPPPLRQDSLPRGGLRRWLNQLLEGVTLRTTLRAGTGIAITETQHGRTIAATVPRDEELAAIVTGVQVAGGQVDPWAMAGNVTYDVQARYAPEIKLTGVAPTYGRPCDDGGAIYPSQTGDRCRIIRERQADGSIQSVLEIMRERVAVSPEC